MTQEEGLAGLSMRKLGGELGVEAMSLYHYVENKDDLLDAMLDCLYTDLEMPLDIPFEDWEAWTRESLRAFHRVLVSHAAALDLFAGRPGKSADSFGVLMWSYKRFAAAGIDPAEANKAIHFGVSFVMGHVASELGSLAMLSQGIGYPERASIGDPFAPEVVAKSQDLTADDRFEAGLDLVVAGLRTVYGLQ